jgi:Uncharacterised nucleotidyltransferase
VDQAAHAVLSVTSSSHAQALAGIAELLKGEEAAWSTFGIAPAELLETCCTEDLTSLVFHRLCEAPRSDWPTSLRQQLRHMARAAAAVEMLRKREINSVLDALGAKGIHPVLLKGTALAYSVYSNPSSRPRADTDLIVPRDQTDALCHVMETLGYAMPNACDGELLFCQFQMAKADRLGMRHAFDIHWKISTQSLFYEVLAYDELDADAVPAPALGGTARVAAPAHALLLACIHPVMHHNNIERLIWVYDIHLLASSLSITELDRFADMAAARGVAAIAAHELALARSRFATRGLDEVIDRLAARRGLEPSAAYLSPGRRWHDDLASNIGALPHWSDRVRLLREIAFPNRHYVLNAYGFPQGGLSAAMLPLLYSRRIVHGAWKIATGRK